MGKKERDAMKAAADAAAARGKQSVGEPLSGASSQPDTVDIGGGERVAIGSVVAGAQARSGLDVVGWNAQTQAQRDAAIEAEIGILRAEALQGLDQAAQPGVSPLVGATGKVPLGQHPTGTYPNRVEPVQVTVAQDPNQSRAVAAQMQADPPVIPGQPTTGADGQQAVVDGRPPVAAEEADLIAVDVPRGFNLTLDDRRVIPISAGSQRLPRAYAEHWYARAHGVRVV